MFFVWHFCFLFRIFSQTFRALICGHKFSDSEFYKNKIVSPCPLAFEIPCLYSFCFICGHWKQKLEIKLSALSGYMEGGTICAL